MPDRRPIVWAILGHRKGDNFQVLALAQALGVPFETRSMRYNLLRKLDKRLLGTHLFSVLPSSRKWLRPPWPDLVIGVGHRSVPVARFIRKQSGGRTKLVQLGNPRLDPSYFDLVVTMPQYRVPDAPNVLRLPFAMASPHPADLPTSEEAAILAKLPRPHRLMVIGGPTKLWLMPPSDMAEAARDLKARCEADGGTLIVVGSPRTEPPVLDAVARIIQGSRHLFARSGQPRYATLLNDADELFVTADSVSMLSEAIFTGKPVGKIPIRLSDRGKQHYAASDAGRRKPPFRNLRKFWERIEADGLVGTLDAPIAGSASDPAQLAADAVREIVPGLPPRPTVSANASSRAEAQTPQNPEPSPADQFQQAS